jgi:hypothetical protein
MSYGAGQSSSAPLEPGLQMPDSRLPVSKVDTPASSIASAYAEKNYRYDPFSRAPITTPFYQQYAERNEFEPLVSLTYNVIEKLDGWWFKAAPVKKMKYNQPVKLTIYPRRALPQVPEDVPPPVWTSYGEEFMTQMDRYSAQFEVEAEFLTFGGQAASDMYTNYVSSLVTGAVISLKLKITATFMMAKQQQWIKGMKSDGAKNMLDVSHSERSFYCSVFRRNKGFYGTMLYAKNLARQANFEFNMAVFPYGTLDKAAMNNFNSESFRNPSAIEMLIMGGKRLAQNTEGGLTVYEDTKWSIAGMSKQEEEPFLHFSMHGGWCYNRGNSDCSEDDDPNCKYGFEYICKGQKNWCEKNLLTLYKESGRYTSSGDIDPHVFTVADSWDYMCRSCRLQPVEGRLDPMMYRVDADLLNTNRVGTVYAVARRFGESDIRYSPLAEIRKHVRRMYAKMKEHLSDREIADIAALEATKKTLINVSNPTESQEGLIAAFAIANSPDTYAYDQGHGGFDVNLSNLQIFLNRDSLTKAPAQIPRIVNLADITIAGGANATTLPAFIRNGNQKAIMISAQVEGGSKDCIILTVRHDDLAAPRLNAYSRGENNSPFGYVAVPVDSWLFHPATWVAYNGAAGTLRWEAANETGVDDAANVGVATTADHAVSSYTSPEIYNSRDTGGRVENLFWALRPTADVTQAHTRAGARAAAPVNLQDAYYRGEHASQGFKPPVITRPPDLPFFMGGINCLRSLASLHTNGDDRGWDKDTLKSCSHGVQALDKFVKVLMMVYTNYNMYFDPNLVPLHIKTDDPELNSLNTAICGLWGEYYRPFLARRPFRLKPAAGNWFFPRSFVAWEDQANSNKTFLTSVGAILRDKFGLAAVTDDAINNAADAYGGAAPAEKVAYTKAVSMSALLDSGALYGNTKEVLYNANAWRSFVAAYEAGDASLTYANYLKQTKPLTYNAPAGNYRTFTRFFENELAPLLTNASGYVKTHFDGAPLSDALLDSISRHMLAFGNILSGLIQMYLDNPKMEYTITDKWLRTKRALALDPGSAVLSRDRSSNELYMIKKYFKDIMETVRNARNVGAAESSSSNTAQYWINTGLMVSSTIWRRIHNEISSILTILATPGQGNESHRLKLSTLYNTPIRPMMGNDYGKPLSGDPITDKQFAVELQARPAQGVAMIRSLAENMSQAMVRGRNSEWLADERRSSNETSFLRSEKLKTHVRDVESLTRDLSSSRFGTDSQRISVPTEFMMRDPSSSGRSPYMVGVQMETEASGIIDGSIEPQYLKYRLSEIDKQFEADIFGRMFAYLWCFSPIHMKVIENLVSHRVKPWGVGHVMLRPFEKDLTGAVLFTVGDPQVAQSGFNAAISSSSFTQQTNKYNIVFAAELGCTIYQQDKVLWLNSQTMHGNKSGMGGDMYTEKDSFAIERASRPEKDGFIVFVGDNLDIKDIPPCVSITSQYNTDRYGSLVNNKAVLSTPEQHLPGLIYTITRFRLNELNPAQWNPRASFWEEKFGAFTNTDCYSEDHRHWNAATRSYANYYMGNWHLSGLTPSDSDFLDGTGVMSGAEVTLSQFKG